MPPRTSLENVTCMLHTSKWSNIPCYAFLGCAWMLEHGNSLIRDYVRGSKSEEALVIFQKMQECRLLPSIYAFVDLIKACRMLKDVEMGKEIHDVVDLHGLLEIDLHIASTLIDMYAKCGYIGEAQKVFHKLPFQSLVTWTVLIAGCVQHGLAEEAIYYFEQMQLDGISPDTAAYACILKACDLASISYGRLIHADVVRKGLEGNLVVGSSLVDMYASCGLFLDAEGVLHKISNRDVVVWTALIAGYAKHDYGNYAFATLERMQYEGISPNNVTLISVLRACGNVVEINKGKEVHAEITEKGLLSTDVPLSNALVDMYATCGNFVEAQSVFIKIVDKDAVSWNVLMGGYIKHNRYQEVLDCYEMMHLEAIPPNFISFICYLRACGELNAIEKGEETHTEIEKKGLQENVLIRSTLVDMYMNCCLPVSAHEIFNKLMTPDVVCWTALIAGYEKNGRFEEAFASFGEMLLKGICPNAVTFVSILRACSSSGDLEKGQEIYAEISRKGLDEEDLSVGNALIDIYIECNLLLRGHEVFDDLPFRDIVSWNIIIGGCAKYGHNEGAINHFKKMHLEGHAANAITYIAILRACSNIEAADRGQQFHVNISVYFSLKENLDVCDSLVSMYAHCGMLSTAKELFETLTTQTTTTWNALIAGYVKHEHAAQALCCFEKMLLEGIAFDSVTVSCATKACGNLQATGKLNKIYFYSSLTGLAEREDVGNALLDAYMKCGLFDEAKIIFGNISHKGSTSWNILIAGYVKQGHAEEGLNRFEQMLLEGATPELTTFTSCLKACSDIGAIHKGEKLHAEISRVRLFEKNHSVGNALVDMYAKCGLLSQAEEVFDRLMVKDLVVWTALLGGHAQLGDYENAFQILEAMIHKGETPNFVALNHVFNACNHAGRVEQGEWFFLTINKTYNIRQTVEQYTSMLDLLSRAGQLEKAAIMLVEMPCHPDLVSYNIFLGACRKWGNLVTGRYAFEHALHLNNIDATAYVCMRNIYTDAGMREEANKIEAMRTRNSCTGTEYVYD